MTECSFDWGGCKTTESAGSGEVGGGVENGEEEAKRGGGELTDVGGDSLVRIVDRPRAHPNFKGKGGVFYEDIRYCLRRRRCVQFIYPINIL